MKLRILIAIAYLALLAGAQAGIAQTIAHGVTAAQMRSQDLAAWAEYRKSASERLEGSSDPRDWATAAMAFHFFLANGADVRKEQELHTSLLSSAITAAPDDVLVQWAVLAAARFDRTDPLYQKALDRLKDIEPENAAVWMEVLVNAAIEKDRNGVSAALHRMAGATTFTNHLAELTDLVIRAYASTPISDSVFEASSRECADCGDRSKEAIPLIAATAVTNAMALPAFQFVMNTCRIDTSDKNADRAEDCRTVGRLMAATGDSFIATRIGFAVLRVSRTFTDEDVAQARKADWIFEKWRSDALPRIDDGLDHYAAEHALAFHADWLQTGSELSAFRNSMERARVPTIPAADWQDRDSPFSEKRLQQDGARKVALDY